MTNCLVDVVNNGGSAIGVYAETYMTGKVESCDISASGTSTGYGAYIFGGTINVNGGRLEGSTAPTGGI